MSHQHNKSFTGNPQNYLQNIVIENAMNLGGNIESTVNLDIPHEEIALDLTIKPGAKILKGEKVVLSKYGTVGSLNPMMEKEIIGKWVPYHSEGDVKSNTSTIGMVEIKAVPGHFDKKFVFTGAMNGCSFLIAKQRLGTKLYAVHYPNSSGFTDDFSLLKTPKLVALASVNYEGEAGYGVPREELEVDLSGRWSNAFCCLHYDSGWKILCQSQFMQIVSEKTVVSINTSKGDNGLIVAGI